MYITPHTATMFTDTCLDTSKGVYDTITNATGVYQSYTPSLISSRFRTRLLHGGT